LTAAPLDRKIAKANGRHVGVMMNFSNRKPMISLFFERHNRPGIRLAGVILLYFALVFTAVSEYPNGRLFSAALVLAFLFHSALAIDAGLCWKSDATSQYDRSVLVVSHIGIAPLVFWADMMCHFHPAYLPIRSAEWYLGCALLVFASIYPAFFLGRAISSLRSSRRG
jgi:hypothetical protein